MLKFVVRQEHHHYQVHGVFYVFLMIFRKNHVFFLKKEIDALKDIMKIKAKVEKKCGRKITIF